MAEPHVPVLLSDVVQMTETMDHEPHLMLDATFGRGGHSRALMNKWPQLKVVATDRDSAAIEYGKENFAAEIKAGRLHLYRADFAALPELLQGPIKEIAPDGFDLILMDLGVSSPQLDDPARGFSFYGQGPLDMRMDQSQDVSAKDIVNSWAEQDLVELFQSLGEIRRPFRVVKAIVEDRQSKEFSSTRDLAALIERVEGWRKKGQHPATKFFLALRLQVNQELQQLQQILPRLIEALRDGGRMIVITFHSLEDRIVKYEFKGNEHGFPVNKKVVQAHWEEKKSNPRARSAKLRVFQRGVKNES